MVPFPSRWWAAVPDTYLDYDRLMCEFIMVRACNKVQVLNGVNGTSTMNVTLSMDKMALEFGNHI